LAGHNRGPTTDIQNIEQTKEKMKEIGVGQFATISGRYYAMDRDKRWERVKLAYDAIRYGKGPTYNDAKAIVEASYEQDIHDEFVIPSVVMTEEGKPVGTVQNDDAIIFFNFRPDRAIQLSQAFANDDFTAFDIGGTLENIAFVQMTEFSDTIQGTVAFETVN